MLGFMDKKKTDLILVVRGDSNDADFVTKATPTTQEELDRFLPLIEAIKKFKPYKGHADELHKPSEHTHYNNWPVGEYGCRQDLGEKTIKELYGDLAQEFDETYVPNGGGDCGFSLHTIHEIYTMRLDTVLYQNEEHLGWRTLCN